MKQRGGAKKLRRSSKHSGKYQAQVHKTAANKARRATKRRKKAEAWVGRKRVGEPPSIKGRSRRRRRSKGWEALAESHGAQKPTVNAAGQAAK